MREHKPVAPALPKWVSISQSPPEEPRGPTKEPAITPTEDLPVPDRSPGAPPVICPVAPSCWQAGQRSLIGPGVGHRALDDDDDAAGGDREVPAHRVANHLGIVLNHLVGDQQIQDRLGRLSASRRRRSGGPGGDADLHRPGDPRRALRHELPAGGAAPGIIRLAAVGAVTAGAPKAINRGWQR